jgi:hypothetical protein
VARSAAANFRRVGDEETIDVEAMIAAAARSGRTVSRRMLQRWRGQGLLPPGQRISGGPALWRYPRGSERQLLRLLHWRSRSRHHRAILLALWVEGFPIDTARVRDAFPLLIYAWEEMAAREIQRAGQGDESVAVATLGAEMARMRGRAPLPHRARMSMAERERAYAYMAASILASERELAIRDPDIPALERLLGLRSGRDGGLSRELGLRDEKGDADRLPTPAEARTALVGASDEELELARRGAWIAVALLPKIVKMLLRGRGAKAVDLIDVIDHLFADPGAEDLALMVPTVLVSIRSNGATGEEIREHLAALAPALAGPELAALSGISLDELISPD